MSANFFIALSMAVPAFLIGVAVINDVCEQRRRQQNREGFR